MQVEYMRCPDCGKHMLLVEENKKVFYKCSNVLKCKTTHSAEPNGKPMGYVADKKTRKARSLAHKAFDAIWKEGLMERKEAYDWLANIMKLRKQEAHISKFNAKQCYELKDKADALKKELEWKTWIENEIMQGK